MATLQQNLDWCTWFNNDRSRIDQLLANPHRVPVEQPPGSIIPIPYSPDPIDVINCYSQWTLAIVNYTGVGAKAVAMMPIKLRSNNTLLDCTIVFPEAPTTSIDQTYPLGSILFLNPCI